MHETSGALRPAIEAYLSGGPMSVEQITAMRAYLRHWILSPGWLDSGNAEVMHLRSRVDALTDRQAITRWLDDALDIGIDPL